MMTYYWVLSRSEGISPIRHSKYVLGVHWASTNSEIQERISIQIFITDLYENVQM